MVILVQVTAMHREEVEGVVITDLGKMTKPMIQEENLVTHYKNLQFGSFRRWLHQGSMWARMVRMLCWQFIRDDDKKKIQEFISETEFKFGNEKL